MSKKSQAKKDELKDQVVPGVTPDETPKEKAVDPIKSVSNGGVAIFRDGMHPRTLRQNSVK